MLIPERLLAQMTTEERDALDAYIDGARNNVAVACPACAHEFEVRLRVKVAVHSRTERARSDGPPRPETENDRLLYAAEHSGLLAAFHATVDRLKPSCRPTDVRAYFLLWTQKKGEVPPIGPRAIAALREALGNDGYLELWQWGGIVGVVLDRHLRMFVPYDYLKGFTGGDRLKMRLPAQDALVAWVRGRFGYVPIDTPLFQESMQERSVGGFARLTQ